MTAPSKWAMDRATEMVADWEHGSDEHRQWLRDMCVPQVADALDSAFRAGRDAEREACAKLCDDDAHTTTPDERRAFLSADQIKPAAWQAARSAIRIRGRRPTAGDLELASWKCGP